MAVLTEIIRYAAKSNHRPFELRVDAKAIKNGFYADLYSLQGEKRTWWTGAAVSQIEFLESSVCSDLIILWERVVSTYWAGDCRSSICRRGSEIGNADSLIVACT